MHELYDISDTASRFALHELFIKYSFLFSWTRMLLNIEVRSYEHNRIDELASLAITGMFLGVLVSIVADIYLGKYNTVLFGVLIGIIQPLFCSVSFLPGDIHRPEDHWLLSRPHVKLLESATVICYLCEGTRIALVLEQMAIPKKQFSVRKFITFVMVMRKLAELLMSLTLIIAFNYPDSYCIFSFIATTCYGVYMNRIIADRKLIREEKMIKGFVWSTLVSVALALGKTVKNIFVEKKSSLYSQLRYHYMVIIGARKIMDLFVIGLTVTALSISFHIIYQYIYMYTRLFMESEFDYAIASFLSAISDFLSILVLILLEFFIIPTLERMELCQTNLQCLKATFVILGVVLVSILAIDCYNNSQFGIGPLVGGSELRIYNGAQNAVTIKYSQFRKELLPTELFVFKISFPNEKNRITIKGESLNKTHNVYTNIFEAETYIVTENMFKKIKTTDPIFKVTPSYNSRPHANGMVVSNDVSFTGILTVNDDVVQMIEDVGFFSAKTGKVNISINGKSISNEPTVLAIGRSYLIFLYHTNGLLVNTTVDALDRPYQMSTFWIVLPLVLTIFARSLSDVSTFCLFYMDSPPNLRSIVFAYFVICYDCGLLIKLLNDNIIVKPTSINIVLTLCNHIIFFLILCYISKTYQFRLAHWL